MGPTRRSYLLVGSCLVLVSQVSGLLLDLFSEKDRHGMSIRVDVSDTECSTLPIAWAEKAASVNTLGSCVQLYDEPRCQGALAIIQPFHTIHQMDLTLINFATRVQSTSACGPKVKTGRYVIQNAGDASVLTVQSKYGGFARAFTVNASSLITKAQQWDVVELDNSEYSLKPREFGDNYPVSYDETSLRLGQIKKKLWKIMSVGRGRYLVKNEPDQRCLYKTEESKVEEHDCRVWSSNQEWVLKEIIGNTKPPKRPPSLGPGANFNVLSKVAGYKPTLRPPPQFAPIFYNVSELAALKRKTTVPPYVIRKKIKRGPRPQSRPLPPLFTHIRPPGLLNRPALSSQLANSNKYLLLKSPQSPNLKEFEPSDDRIETYAYYQQVLLAKTMKQQLQRERIKQALEAGLLEGPPLPPAPTKTTKKKKKGEENDDEDSEEEDEREPKEEEEDEEQSDEEKKKEKDSEEEDEDSDEDDKKKKRSKDKGPPPVKLPPRPNPYDINFSAFDPHSNHSEVSHNTPEQEEEEKSTGLLSSMFTRVKSMLPSTPSFLSSSSSSTSTSRKQKEVPQESPSQPQATTSHRHTYHKNYDEKDYKRDSKKMVRPPKGGAFRLRSNSTGTKAKRLFGLFG